jgi:hypothetical protein
VPSSGGSSGRGNNSKPPSASPSPLPVRTTAYVATNGKERKGDDKNDKHKKTNKEPTNKNNKETQHKDGKEVGDKNINTSKLSPTRFERKKVPYYVSNTFPRGRSVGKEGREGKEGGNNNNNNNNVSVDVDRLLGREGEGYVDTPAHKLYNYRRANNVDGMGNIFVYYPSLDGASGERGRGGGEGGNNNNNSNNNNNTNDNNTNSNKFLDLIRSVSPVKIDRENHHYKHHHHHSHSIGGHVHTGRVSRTSSSML